MNELLAGLNDKTRSAYVNDNYNGALELSQHAVQLADEARAPKGQEYADAYIQAAWFIHMSEDKAPARDLYKQALAVLERTYGSDDGRIADLLRRYALTCEETGQRAQALKHLERALAIAGHLGPEQPELLRGVLLDLVSLHLNRNKFSLAEPYYRWALALARHQHGADSETYLALLHDYATSCATHGKLMQAMEAMATAFEGLVGRFANQPTEKVALLSDYANILADEGQYEKAEKLLREAAELAESAKLEPMMLHSVLSDLGDLYTDMEQPKLAGTCHDRADALLTAFTDSHTEDLPTPAWSREARERHFLTLQWPVTGYTRPEQVADNFTTLAEPRRPIRKLPAGTELILDMAYEGGGTTVYGRKHGEAWQFTSKSSHMDVDEQGDFWSQAETTATASLADHLPNKWHIWMHPSSIHPAFIGQIRELYLAALAQIKSDGTPINSHARHDWLRYLYLPEG